MPPSKPLPYSDAYYSSADEYIDALLSFVTSSKHFLLLSGGVHILDFFTSEPGLFNVAFPEPWRRFLTRCDPMALLNLLARADLSTNEALPGESDEAGPAPESLLEFIRNVRRLSLDRSFDAEANPPRLRALPRAVALGMGTKKVHEVTNFAGFVDRLVADVSANEAAHQPITHLVDFGSGQNYLGRALASEPYNHRVVAVEGRENNIAGAIKIDVLAGVAEKETVRRNKKMWLQSRLAAGENADVNEKFRRRLEKLERMGVGPQKDADLRPCEELKVSYVEAEGKGYIQYVQGRLEDGDLSAVIPQIRGGVVGDEGILQELQQGQEQGQALQQGHKQEQEGLQIQQPKVSLLGISIHSCGNLTHHAIRSLVLNPSVRAVAVVGCCYNLTTERLGPPDHKLPFLRPTLQPLNGRAIREQERFDPHGFPMSWRLCEYGWGDTGQSGIRLNNSARMMACQAMSNWTETESSDFFTRHFYRAVLQKMFLDKGVVSYAYVYGDHTPPKEDSGERPFDKSTTPIILGSLSKPCYRSFRAYVRGAVRKLTTGCKSSVPGDNPNTPSPTPSSHAAIVAERMGESALSDAEIDAYEARYAHRRSELSAAWSLMAFSAQVAEAVMVVDRWQFLREQEGVVRCWVESVFEYGLSPRNLVVVGVKG